MSLNNHGYKELLRLVQSLERSPNSESFLTLGIKDMTKLYAKAVLMKFMKLASIWRWT
jgi:hypothetical protein